VYWALLIIIILVLIYRYSWYISIFVSIIILYITLDCRQQEVSCSKQMCTGIILIQLIPDIYQQSPTNLYTLSKKTKYLWVWPDLPTPIRQKNVRSEKSRDFNVMNIKKRNNFSHNSIIEFQSKYKEHNKTKIKKLIYLLSLKHWCHINLLQYINIYGAQNA